MIKLMSPQTSLSGSPIALASSLQLCHRLLWWWLAPASVHRGSPIGDASCGASTAVAPTSSHVQAPCNSCWWCSSCQCSGPDADAASFFMFAYFISCVFAPSLSFLGHSRHSPLEMVKKEASGPEVCPASALFLWWWLKLMCLGSDPWGWVFPRNTLAPCLNGP